MRTILQTSAVLLLIAVSNYAQQPGQPGFQTRLQSIVRQNGPVSTNNYQLELTMQRAEKTARYKLTLSGGAVTTELVDRLAERFEAAPPLVINFSANLTPFEEGGGGDVSISLGRSIPFKTNAQQAAPGTDKEVLNLRSVGLTTRVALFTGKPVTIFEDDDEKISLKLTEVASEKP